MKYIKYYENIDPYEEEWESDEPYTEFEEYLLTQYPDENEWSEIKVLDCSYNNLTSLDGIENLTNLELIYCHNNNLTSLGDIENLRNLKELYCPYNNLTSLNGIENLTNLKYIYCSDNNFTREYKRYLRRYCRKNKIYLTT